MVEDANCLCVCGGYLHLMALLAFDHMMANRGVVLKGVLYNWVIDESRILITPKMIAQLFDGRLAFVQEDFDSYNPKKAMMENALGGLLPATVSYLHQKSIATSSNVPSTAHGDAFYLCYAACGLPPYFTIDAALRQGKPLVTVELEEGVGTYASSVHEWRCIGSARSEHPIKKPLYRLYETVLYPWDSWFDRILRQKCAHLCSTVFERDGTTLLRNEELRPYLARATKALTSLSSDAARSDYSNAAIITSSKFDLFGWSDAELAVLRRIIASLRERKIPIILRPHPGTKDLSRYDALGVDIDEASSVPFEVSLAQSDGLPLMVIGFASTALVYANALYGIPAFSLEELLEAEASKEQATSSVMRTFMADAQWIFNLFQRPYKRPSTYQEFNSYIEETALKTLS